MSTVKCPRCKMIFTTDQKKINKEIVQAVATLFRSRNTESSVNVIMEFLSKMKNNGPFGLTVDQFVEILDILNGYTPFTVTRIAKHLEFRTSKYIDKHPHYFRSAIIAIASEVQTTHVTSNYRRNV